MTVSRILADLANETKCLSQMVQSAALCTYPNLVRTNACIDSDLVDQFKSDVRLELLIRRTGGKSYGRNSFA